jgi:hypothetical protein
MPNDRSGELGDFNAYRSFDQVSANPLHILCSLRGTTRRPTPPDPRAASLHLVPTTSFNLQTMRPMVHPSESDNALMDLENAEEFLRYAKLLDRGRLNFRSIQWDKVKLVNTSVDMSEVDQVHESQVCVKHSSIPTCPQDPNLTHELLNKLAVLKLNGGLGTTMGCKGRYVSVCCECNNIHSNESDCEYEYALLRRSATFCCLA